MAADRDDTLKRADKLLKHGKLAEAIQEYVRLVEDRPHDWSSANALGDLYVKAGDVDRAVEQFTRVADHLYGEGFFPRASAVYKKVLKVRGDDDHAIWQLADIAGRNGLGLDARSYYARLIRDRRGRGDERGAVDCLVRVGLLEDAEVEARMVAARALIERGESKQAARVLFGAAGELTKQGRMVEALEALTQAGQLDPDDPEIREKLLASPVADAHEPPERVEPVTVEAPIAQLEPVAAEAVAEPEVVHEEPVAVETPIAHEEPVEDLVMAVVDEPAIGLEPPPGDLESFFEQLRADVAHKQETIAREQFERGVRHLEAGRLVEAVADLEEAARIPTMRFEASARLARICIGRHEIQAGVEWMERAAEAPAPTPDQRLALLYDLADALGQMGETARALAVLMEIEADSAGYRDVPDRIAMLSREQAGSRGA